MQISTLMGPEILIVVTFTMSNPLFSPLILVEAVWDSMPVFLA